MDLVLRARAGAHQLRAPRQSPAQHARPLIRRPHGVELAGRKQPRQRPRVQPVGLRPRLANTGIGGTDHDDAGDVPLQDPRDLPRAPRHLERHPVRRRQTLPRTAQAHPASSRSDRRSAARRPQRSRPHRNRGARPTRSLSPQIPPRPPPLTNGEPAGQRQRPMRARGTSGQVAGAATQTSRARSSSSNTACPTTFSVKAPVPDDRPYGRARTATLTYAVSCPESE